MLGVKRTIEEASGEIEALQTQRAPEVKSRFLGEPCRSTL
jgi:hypothetical protein